MLPGQAISRFLASYPMKIRAYLDLQKKRDDIIQSQAIQINYLIQI